MDSEECAECLNKYLNYESIRSDEAVNAIRKDYNNLVRQRKIEGGLPEAWGMLVQEADGVWSRLWQKKLKVYVDIAPTMNK